MNEISTKYLDEKSDDIFTVQAMNINDPFVTEEEKKTILEMKDNYLVTESGDIAFKDKDDFYFITGRKNRISKIFGLRLDLDEFEKFLKKNNIISKCEIDNKILKILVINKYSSRHIKSIVSKFLNINENYILVTRVKKYLRKNIFK